MGTQAVPIRLRVWPFRFPKQPALGVGGWCYSDGDGTYGVNARNRAAFLQHLRERFVNMPWAGAGVMTSFEFVAAGGSSVKLDTRRFDEWIGRWPDARQYMVFLAVGPEFAGQAAGTPEFGRRVGAWISAWVRHLASKGVEPHRLGLLIHDEPHEATDVSAIVAWARAIRSAEPKVLLWVDPTYEEPRKAPAELFAVHDVLCPNRPMWLGRRRRFAISTWTNSAKGDGFSSTPARARPSSSIRIVTIGSRRGTVLPLGLRLPPSGRLGTTAGRRRGTSTWRRPGRLRRFSSTKPR